MRTKNFIVAAAATVATTLSFHTALYHLNDRFDIANIQGPIDAFAQSTSTDILEQPFHYIGQGSQCYIFASEDDKTVIKFFKHQRFRLPYAIAWIAPQKNEIKKRKWVDLKKSCQLAATKLWKESGLITCHLAESNIFKNKIYISDKLGRKYEVDLDSHDWVLQKKGTLLYQTLTTFMESGQEEKAREALKNLVSLLRYRIDLGIDDRDAVLSKNVGFLGTEAFFIDLGGFSEGKKVTDGEIVRVTRRLNEWLESYPQLAAHLNELTHQ